MALRELVFLAGADEVDRWSDALLEAGALSVQAEDADADSPDEQALYGEPGIPAVRAGWERTRLTALLAEDEEPAALLSRAAAEAGLPVPGACEVRELADRDWVGASQAQFAPIPVGDRLLITPSWHVEALRSGEANRPDDGRVTIVLDPGLAFGTGSHPTTHMCLQWLGENLRPGERVIDYGCGSGILAIAAALLGAARVVGVDIDPQAVTSTRANAQVNGVDLDVRLSTEPPPEPADVVVANILSNPLKVLAPMLSSLVAPGGRLVLAGLLDRQAAEVAAAYPDIELAVYAEREGWACLAGPKRP
ncbi:MAG TPA: 50S ribosomal protein L11 methyltransferase [Quisquiliibacterium sp.]|nr:50S ribosomal protein L11 methyltransferase [Quisquiliibacterium sp.]